MILLENFQIKSRLNLYSELIRVAKIEAIGVSNSRSLEQDKPTDFTCKNFVKHIAHLHSKYPSRGKIEIYKDSTDSSKKAKTMVYRLD